MAEEPTEVEPGAWQTALDWLFALDRRPDDPALAAQLEAWLREDPAHRRAYEQARLIWDLAQRMRRAPHPLRGRPIARRGLLAGAVGLAACLAFAVGADIGAGPDADYGTPVGQIRSVALPDGSRLTLDTDSAVRLAFGPSERRIELLRGRAYFDVARDPARRFVVIAAEARIEAVGTAFEVCRDGGAVGVAIEHGRVRVGVDARDRRPGGALAAGDRLRLDLATGIAERDTIPRDRLAPWRQGRLVVDRRPVSDVLAELGRYHRGYVVLRDHALGAKPVSGVYDLTRPIAAMRAVVEAYGGRLVEITPYLLIATGA